MIALGAYGRCGDTGADSSHADGSISQAAAKRKQIFLAGGWFIKQLETEKADVAALMREAASPDSTWLSARMPAQVHDVLFQHGRISDPRIGRNAAECTWVGDKDWAYTCKFRSPEKVAGPALLCFGGLDTLATVYINRAEIGRFDNMYREYAVDVQKHLAPAGNDNVLLIVFASPTRFIAQVKPSEAAKGLPKHKYLRKCHCDFGSYLGARPNSVKVGVFRDVVLDLPDRAWIEDVWVRSELSRNFTRVTIRAHVAVAGARAALDWTLTGPAGEEVARGAAKPKGDAFELAVNVNDPKLWWPRTHGAPNLYRLEVRLRSGGDLLDSRVVSFGIRDVKPVLTDPATGEKRFRFDVNGRPIFMRGACWAPLEGMTHCWNRERAMRLLDLVEQGNMNILRIWGEGCIPPQEFYDECDRRGIFIWQDFMFGYGMHPTDNPAFAENCRLEIEGMIRALRSHPCLLLWVGGNENHMGVDFAGGKITVGRELFEKIMPEACARLDPTRLFHPSSPYGGRAPNWPLEGDWHDYTTLTFSPEASVPLFASEVGRASAPSLTSMRRFLSDEDLWPKGFDPAIRKPGQAAWPPMWQYRSVDGSWDKVGALEQYGDPASAQDLIRALGTAHGEYLHQRVERERRGVPDGAPAGNRRCWGNMVWRLNDGWPILYWSVVDYYLEPKIPYYFLRRAYEPVLVCFERTPDKVFAWVVNDSARAVAGTLKVRRLRFDGKERGELEAAVTVKPGEARRCLDTTDLGPINLRGEFLEAALVPTETAHRWPNARATMLLIGERYLHLPQARLTARVVGSQIEIATDVFARQVTLEMNDVTGAVFEDNFFDLSPGEERTIVIPFAAGGKRVMVRALNADPVGVSLP
jgi:hypothetical protein